MVAHFKQSMKYANSRWGLKGTQIFSVLNVQFASYFCNISLSYVSEGVKNGSVGVVEQVDATSVQNMDTRTNFNTKLLLKYIIVLFLSLISHIIITVALFFFLFFFYSPCIQDVLLQWDAPGIDKVIWKVSKTFYLMSTNHLDQKLY